MNKMTSEFAHYGNGTAAGFKGNSREAIANSREAAADVGKTLARRHSQMMAAWTPYGAAGAIPEQIADDLRMAVHLIRPRAGELVKRGLLFEVGRRQGDYRKSVTAYSVQRPEASGVAQ
ncbi:MAG: hypothetical protein ABIT10_10460 [Alteraurantiacibacter sp.]